MPAHSVTLFYFLEIYVTRANKDKVYSMSSTIPWNPSDWNTNIGVAPHYAILCSVVCLKMCWCISVVCYYSGYSTCTITVLIILQCLQYYSGYNITVFTIL